jgi:hypothetical protein
MSIPIPVPRLGAGHDLLTAVGLLVPIFAIGKEEKKKKRMELAK